MASTDATFAAFDCAIAASVVFDITFGGVTETYTGPTSGNAVALAVDLESWIEDAGRGWAPKTATINWYQDTGGVLCNLSASSPFSLTYISGTNSLRLEDCAAAFNTVGLIPADGTWSPYLVRLPPLWAKVGTGTASRNMSQGGPLRADATHGTTVKAAALQAFCHSVDVVRLSSVIQDTDGLTTAVLFCDDDGTETALRWEPYSETRLDDVYTVTLQIWQEV